MPFEKAQNNADFRHDQESGNTYVHPDEKMPLRKGEDAENEVLDQEK